MSPPYYHAKPSAEVTGGDWETFPEEPPEAKDWEPDLDGIPAPAGPPSFRSSRYLTVEVERAISAHNASAIRAFSAMSTGSGSSVASECRGTTPFSTSSLPSAAAPRDPAKHLPVIDAGSGQPNKTESKNEPATGLEVQVNPKANTPASTKSISTSVVKDNNTDHAHPTVLPLAVHMDLENTFKDPNRVPPHLRYPKQVLSVSVQTQEHSPPASHSGLPSKDSLRHQSPVPDPGRPLVTGILQPKSAKMHERIQELRLLRTMEEEMGVAQGATDDELINMSEKDFKAYLTSVRSDHYLWAIIN